MTRNTYLPLLAGAGLLMLAGSANALIIDDFNTGSLPFPGVFATGPTGSDTDTQNGTMLGGTRQIDLQMLAGNGNTAVTVAGGVLDINNGTTERSDVTTSWDFSSTDLTDGGLALGFFLSLPSAIDNDMDVTFTVEDGTDSSTITQSFPDGASGPDFFFEFASFTGGADFTTAETISMLISSDETGLDTQVNLLETRPSPPINVPAPGTLVLFGLGLAGLGLLRRRTNQS